MLQKTVVQSPAHTLGSSQLRATPSPGDPAPLVSDSCMFSLLSLKLVCDLVIPALRRQEGGSQSCYMETIRKAPTRISWEVDTVLLSCGVWSVWAERVLRNFGPAVQLECAIPGLVLSLLSLLHLPFLKCWAVVNSGNVFFTDCSTCSVRSCFHIQFRM